MKGVSFSTWAKLPLVWTVCVALSLGPSVAVAQDGMSFGADEVSEAEVSDEAPAAEDEAAPPPPSDPPADTPPSEALSKYIKTYESKKYAEAAVGFQGIVDGQPKDTPGNVQEAQFFLGKSYYKMGFYQSALTIFDEISQMGTGHLFHGESLEWLAQLAYELPEPADVSQKVGRYGVEELGRFNNDKDADLYNELLFLLGKSKYRENRYQAATDILRKVRPDSKRYIEAKFVEGISYVQLKKAKPATSAFREILEVIDEGDANTEEEDRYRNLAWLSLARVYYTAANRTNASGAKSVDGRLLGNAVTSWNNVERTSEYWLDALFEASWAFFLADEYSRALGNVHTLFSPYFEDAYYPEATVIKAVTFFVNCQIENARAMVARFHKRYDPVQQEMVRELDKYKDNAAFYNFLLRVRDGKDTLPPRIRGIVKDALSDRALLRHVEYVNAMKVEEEKLKEAPASFRSSPAGARVSQDIAVAKAFAIDKTGDLARARISRRLKELQALQNQVDTIDLEITTFQRGQLSQELQKQQTAAAKSKGGDVEVDEEHQIWPFNGEYWRDELGFYRQQVTNKCGR